MKRFLKSVGLFSFIILSPILLELFVLPNDYFNYRSWEALMVKDYTNYFYGYFYPNQTLSKTEVGDSAHHTPYAQPKDVYWKTDSLGFRNTHFKRNAKVIFVGDSQTAGCALDQKDILSEAFEAKTGISSYNVAQDKNMSKYFALRNAGILEKPDIVIFQTVERNLPLPELMAKHTAPDKTSFIQEYGLTNAMIFADRLSKGSMKNYFSARLSNVQGYGVLSPLKKDFLYVPIFMHPLDETRLEKTIELAQEYKNYFESEGTIFILMVVPNKETIYYNYVPTTQNQQPGLMPLLSKRLTQKGIYNIDLFSIFNEKRAADEMVYYLDDAHWNAQGVDIAVKEVIKLIEKEQLLKSL